MSLQEQLQQEIKAAMLSRDAQRLGTLRLLKSAVGYYQIEKKKETLTDAEVIAIAQREVKKRRDSMEQFTLGGRPELAASEQAELAILEGFLPPAVPEAELERVAREVIQNLGATDRKQMGPVIKAVQEQLGAGADGRSVSLIVGRLLS